MARQIGELPNALGEGEALARRFAGQRPAVFLDYDGTLTPIRDRPEDAVISDSMYFNPKAMDHLRGLTFPMRFRGLLIKVTLEDGRLRVGAEVDSLNRSVKVGIGDQVREIRSGESYTFDL